ncbi:MAG: hypothetical protein HY907_15190 [Deltaproteobacteria bacterium]|nr:hypothetical protein [Deltaproteobacteria bacterium]
MAAGCSGAGGVSDDDAVADGRDTTRDVPTDATLPEASELPPVCGDGELNVGEECDDGNRLNGDGCDWMCRLTDEPFEYPPPDPDAPRVEPAGPEAVVTEVEEISAFVAGRNPGSRAIWLAAASGRFAVAYNYDQPYYGVRLRQLDRSGTGVGSPWQHETPWGVFAQGLMAVDDGFGLLSGSHVYGLLRSRFRTDGTATEEFRTLRGPLAVSGIADRLSGSAWSPGRWLAASALNGAEFRGWLLETFSEDGTPLADGLVVHEPLGACAAALAVGGGFVVGDARGVVRLDEELRVVSWSGTVDEYQMSGVVGLARDGYWLAWLRGQETHEYPLPFDLWLVATDFDGTPRFPPRRVLESVPRAIVGDGSGGGSDFGLAVADGPAGAAIVLWQGVVDGPLFSGGPVVILTVDDWGNVITPPTRVLAEGVSTTMGWVTALAADEEGYGVVTMMQGETLGTAVILFRYFQIVR